MKSLSSSLSTFSVLAALCLSSSHSRADNETTPAGKATPLAEQAPDNSAATPETADVPAAEPVEINGFGSDEPVERTDLPTRGHIVIPAVDIPFKVMTHWTQYETHFTAPRWGRYRVQVTYELSSPLGLQVRVNEDRVKAPLKVSKNDPVKAWLKGTVYIAAPGKQALYAYLPGSTGQDVFKMKEIRLVPTAEGEIPVAAKDENDKEEVARPIVLPASAATTWSESMRYEPKPEKKCLGFWTDPKDWAEWEFAVSKPGNYKVKLWQGCPEKDAGSTVEVECAGQKLSYKVQPTQDFHDQVPVDLGTIEFKAPSPRTLLSVKPQDKKGAAVFDISKIELIPQ